MIRALAALFAICRASAAHAFQLIAARSLGTAFADAPSQARPPAHPAARYI
jgi:hypothetical protein